VTAPRRRRWTDRQVEQVVGNLLRVGVALAACVVFGGGLAYLVRYGTAEPHYRVFESEQSALRNLDEIAAAALHGRSRAVIQVGLVLLILTPVARVAFSLFAFVRERDWVYGLVTAIVLAVLLASLLSR
jgi:uncharacterized membrane protein